MKRVVLLLTALSLALNACSQNKEMSNEKLGAIINNLSEHVEGENGNWKFIIDSTLFICIADVSHNRMRIISPVEDLTKVTEEQLLKCMEANFHTVLDSKYAISEGTLWSVFIHPLKELSEEQVISAIAQVYSTAKTYGSVYSSGLLSFPKQKERIEKKKSKKL